MATTVKTGINRTPYSTATQTRSIPNQSNKCHTCGTKVKTRNNAHPSRPFASQIRECEYCGSVDCMGNCNQGQGDDMCDAH